MSSRLSGHPVIYHVPGTRSSRVVMLLAELGDVPYEAFRVDSLQSEEFRMLSPMAKVPVMKDGDIVIFESGAIVEYLLERYGNGRLAPSMAEQPEKRAFYLQWLHFAEATLLPGVMDFYFHTRRLPEGRRSDAVATGGRNRAMKAFPVVEMALQGRDFLLGADLSAADIMMGFSLFQAVRTGLMKEEEFPNCAAYLRRLKGRPSWVKAFGVPRVLSGGKGSPWHLSPKVSPRVSPSASFDGLPPSPPFFEGIPPSP